MNAVNSAHMCLAARAVAEDLFPLDDREPVDSRHLLREAIFWRLADPARTDAALAAWFDDAVAVLPVIPGNRTAAEHTASLLFRANLFVETERDTVDRVAQALADYPGYTTAAAWLALDRRAQSDPRSEVYPDVDESTDGGDGLEGPALN